MAAGKGGLKEIASQLSWTGRVRGLRRKRDDIEVVAGCLNGISRIIQTRRRTVVVHHDESLDHGGFLLSSRRTSSEEFAEECAPESWNRSPRERGESRAYSPSGR